jgi:hypothetical protein
MNSRRQDCADRRSTPRAVYAWQPRAIMIGLLFVGARHTVPGANAWQRRALIIRILFVGAQHAAPGANAWQDTAHSTLTHFRRSQLRLRHKKPREARSLALLFPQQVFGLFYFGGTDQDTTRRRAADAASESVGSGNSSDTR